MTYSEMVELISKDTGKTKAEVRSILDSLTFSLKEVLKNGGSFKIPGFGKFSQKVVKPRLVFGTMSKGKISVKFSPYSAAEKRE